MDEGAIADGEVDTRSIVDVRPSDLVGFDQCHFFAGVGVWSYALRLAGWPDDRQVWTGSCPCQPFSAAGKGGGFDDERHLWPAWFWLIAQCEPARIYGEQVASKDGLAWLDLVYADLEGAGYAVGAADLCAAGVGAPHIRQRLFIVADAMHTFRRTVGFDGENGRDGADGGRAQAYGVAGTCGEVHELEHAARDGRVERRTEPGEWRLVGGRGDDELAGGGVAQGDAERSRLEGFRRSSDDGREPGRLDALAAGSIAAAGDVVRPGPLNGFWRAADWIGCTDGRWRAVEPGAFPLVNGASFRVGRGGAALDDARSNRGAPWAGKSRAQMLRGYGNAICAEVAVEFIRATA